MSRAAFAQQTLSTQQVRPYDPEITDLKMPGSSGLDLLKEIRSQHPETTMITPTALGTVETAVEAMKAGAYDYLTKPAYAEQMSLVVGQALEHCPLGGKFTSCAPPST